MWGKGFDAILWLNKIENGTHTSRLRHYDPNTLSSLSQTIETRLMAIGDSLIKNKAMLMLASLSLEYIIR